MNNLKWWQSAVFYQVYPRSFADSNGDGIGDLKGITSKLDYLKALGIDAIWLSPHYPSPQFDCGYDIADYTAVEPEYGTLENFKELLREAHARGLRLILDLVLNHTSDLHPWFLESRSSRDNPKRDWYIWQDGKDGGPPNNWNSPFDFTAWKLDEKTGQYYYHYFFSQQPDLNWRNPEVKQAMWDAVRFWLDLGVDGFRLDALGTIYETPGFPDHASQISMIDLYRDSETRQMSPEAVQVAYREIFKHQVDLPEVLDLMKELREVVNAYPDRVLVGETDDIRYHGSGDDALNLVFNFPMVETERLTPAHIRANQRKRLSALPPLAWPCNTLGNHDSPRVKSRFGDGKNDEALARLHLALMLTLRGTPFLYNGEEIGMTNHLLGELGQIRDNVAMFYYKGATELLGMPADKALEIAVANTRDRCRTPMQWDSSPNAGFSPAGVQPWLPVNPNYRDGINVAAQESDPASMLNFYRTLLQLRKNTPALVDGDYMPLHEEAQDYLAFLRQSLHSGQDCVVVLNLSDQPLSLHFDLQPNQARRLYASAQPAGEVDDLGALSLAPFEIYIAELT